MSLQSSQEPKQQTESALPGPAGYEPAGLVRYAANREADWNGAGQRFRFVQHRHWPIQLAHRWTDACSGPFVATLDRAGLLPHTTRVRAELFGSLGATGHGHGSYNAVRWGWRARIQKPSIPPAARYEPTRSGEPGQLRLNGTHTVTFDPEDDLILHRRRSLPFHPTA